MSEKATLLSNRIADILQQLNSGKTISVKELAQYYGVTERTIQKDLNERLDPKLIEVLGGGKYRLVPGYLGNITIEDIKEFSRLSGIIDLYPDIDDVLRHKIRDSLIVEDRINRSCIPSSDLFMEINYTINNSLLLRLSYSEKNLVVEPYRLLNHSGIWYLLARNAGKIKSYCLHKMKKVRRDIKTFEIDERLITQISENPSPWFREDKIEVTLSVKRAFIDYFNNRNLFPQCYNKVLLDSGDLSVKLKVNTTDEIKGQIKYWLPQIDVIEPKTLKDEILKDIKSFLS